MYRVNQGSIAAFGYRDLDESRFPGIVRDIDAALQATDKLPRRITWDGDNIAMIDRDGMRIALGFLPPTAKNKRSHLVLAVGTTEQAESEMLGAVPNIHLADRLLLRIKDDLPFDTIMRGETPAQVDSELIWMMFEQLADAPTQAGSLDPLPLSEPVPEGRGDSFQDFEVIDAEDVKVSQTGLISFLTARAAPTPPLRLSVHMTGLLVALFSAPLGVAMFAYSVLRDVTGGRS